MGRPFKPYQASWGKCIDGLARGADKRWRVVATGERFREVDERRAVAKFMAMTGNQTVAVTVSTHASVDDAFINGPSLDVSLEESLITGEAPRSSLSSHTNRDGGISFTRDMPTPALWAWIREELIARPEHAAKMTGIPELARLADLPSLKPVKLTDVQEAYETRNLSGPVTKARAVKFFKEFSKVTGATLLTDLTQDNIKVYRDGIEKNAPAPSTRKWIFGQVKSVLAFALKAGIDAVQVRTALDKCRVLWVGEKMPAAKPCPISPADFQALLAGADDKWPAVMLLGLNLCLHLGEVASLKWESFQGDYYSTLRVKTGVARGAVLWQETKNAMAKLPRKGPYLFTSRNGTKFERAGFSNSFADLRRRVGVADGVTFEGVRDGAYTAALQNCDEKIVRVLAGHKSAGMLDAYVLRNPECTRPAVEAVHSVYFPS